MKKKAELTLAETELSAKKQELELAEQGQKDAKKQEVKTAEEKVATKKEAYEAAVKLLNEKKG